MTRPLRILVADDESGDAMLMRRAFLNSGTGVPVSFVQNGQQAIEFLGRKPPFEHLADEPLPTLVVLDLKMPGLDGFEVLRWIRRHPRFRNILVIVFSSSDEPDDMRQAYALGADVYVLKPHDPDEFMEAVHDMERYWLRLNATPECGSVLH